MEELNGNYKLECVETYEGTAGDLKTIWPHNYVGFAEIETKQVTIEADGTSVVDFYYPRNKYNLVVNTETGANIINNVNGEHKYEEEINVECSFDRGYEFKEVSGDVSTLSYTMPADNIEMTVVGKPIEYSISYDLVGGKEYTNKTSYNVTTESFTLNIPNKAGYEFEGWTGTDLDQITRICSTLEQDYRN